MRYFTTYSPSYILRTSEHPLRHLPTGIECDNVCKYHRPFVEQKILFVTLGVIKFQANIDMNLVTLLSYFNLIRMFNRRAPQVSLFQS